MTTVLAPKRTTETKLYTLDWTTQLGDDTIASAVLAVTVGTVTYSSLQTADTQVSVLIAGGANGEIASLTLTVTTNGGQILARDYVLSVTSTAVSPFPSTTSKGQIEDMAFEECTLAGYSFDASPEEQASGLRRLDALMSGPLAWIDYNAPTAVGASLQTDASGVPDIALDAVVIKLALSIAPAIGKNLSAESRLRMNESLRAIRAALAVIPDITLPPTTAQGAGAKPWSTWRPYFPGTN